MEGVIVGGTSSQKLARSIAKLLRFKFVDVEYKKFPDGESYVRLEKSIFRKNVVLVQTLYPQNDSLVELFFLLDLINEFQPKNICLVMPYFAYARQHKRYRKWEAISSKTIAKLIENFGVKEIITFDLHDKSVIDFFNIEVVHLTASELIAKYFLKMRLKNPFVLIPDQEREEMAKVASKILNCDYSFLKKYRSRVTGEIKTKIWKDFDIKGKDVLILDDIISTGKTMLNAIKIAKEKGAKNIFVACVHYIPSEVYKKMLSEGTKLVVATNTIPSSISKVNITPLISNKLKII
ncbi:MAG: ribose-phosphate diphosphokinase [Candidatus Aenigmarchaeota archaeon]|nr:ribose-phosphate diphosphokinase [Candidatus Aenigmarchaeota archaeon]